MTGAVITGSWLSYATMISSGDSLIESMPMPVPMLILQPIMRQSRIPVSKVEAFEHQVKQHI